eukprot:INCI18127.2.p2 GENE.INCI18127.2~~INCI18127.2.p2  ORF type:complete len:118 (-),score=18.11 INCI18127.2:211-564(-)
MREKYPGLCARAAVRVCTLYGHDYFFCQCCYESDRRARLQYCLRHFGDIVFSSLKFSIPLVRAGSSSRCVLSLALAFFDGPFAASSDCPPWARKYANRPVGFAVLSAQWLGQGKDNL